MTINMRALKAGALMAAFGLAVTGIANIGTDQAPQAAKPQDSAPVATAPVAQEIDPARSSLTIDGKTYIYVPDDTKCKLPPDATPEQTYQNRMCRPYRIIVAP